MNKATLLHMSPKEIETFLNANITNINFESEYDTLIKAKMIDTVTSLFDNTVEISHDYRLIRITINDINITFKVSTKITGKTVEISRLRKKDIKTVGKFKFNHISITFSSPFFEADDLNNFKVKLSSTYRGASITLKQKNCKIIGMLTKTALLTEIEKQDSEWKNIRKSIIIRAVQPFLIPLNRKFNQYDFNDLMNKTYKHNKELIESEIDKIVDIDKLTDIT